MISKKILLLGATGGTGRELLARALSRGYEVTVLVRDRGRFADAPSSVRVVVGDVLDPGSVADAVRGQGSVVSALGVGTRLKSGGLIARAVPAIVRAMEREQVRRILLTSAYGVGDSIRDVPAIPRLLIRLFLRDIYADKMAGEEQLRASGLDWTIVRPVTLTNGPATGRFRAGERLALRGVPRVSRADVAEFLIGEIDGRAFVRKDVLVSS